jgi:hypothetical protein
MIICPICGNPVDEDGYCTNILCDGHMSIFAMKEAVEKENDHTDEEIL